MLFFFFISLLLSFHPWLGCNQRQAAWIAGLSDWLVISLPYSGVCHVNAGLGGGVYQINRMSSLKRGTRGSRWKFNGVVSKNASPSKFISGLVRRAEAPRWWTFISNFSDLTLSPSWDSSFVFWSPVYAYSICIFLPWLIMKKIYLFFVTVLWCAITHVFLHTVNILWILLFKKMILRSR